MPPEIEKTLVVNLKKPLTEEPKKKIKKIIIRKKKINLVNED